MMLNQYLNLNLFLRKLMKHRVECNIYYLICNVYFLQVVSWIIIINVIFILFIHTEDSFLNLVKSYQIWILITLFQLILHQTEFHFVSNQWKKCNNNPELVSSDKIYLGVLCIIRIIRLINLTMYMNRNS